MEILKIKIDNLTINQVLQKVENFLNDEQQHYIVTLNPEFLVKARKDKEFQMILNQADLSVADGIGLVFASYLLKKPIKQRIAGVDLMEKICQKAAQKNWLICFLGAESGIAEKAAENLEKKYPGLKIKAKQEPDNDLEADIVFVAFGAPKQEKWINSNLKRFPSVKLAMGVGGSFDFVSNNVKRAPKFLRIIGLEWLWRLIIQPWRIKRVFKAIIVFPLLFFKYHFFKKN